MTVTNAVARLRRFQVADVLADEDVRPDAQRDGVLQVRADREQRRRRVAQIGIGSGA